MQKHICAFLLDLEVKNIIPSQNWAIALYIDQPTLSHVIHIAWSLGYKILFCGTLVVVTRLPGLRWVSQLLLLFLTKLSESYTWETISSQAEKEQALSKRCFQLLARAVGTTFFTDINARQRWFGWSHMHVLEFYSTAGWIVSGHIRGSGLRVKWEISELKLGQQLIQRSRICRIWSMKSTRSDKIHEN